MKGLVNPKGYMYELYMNVYVCVGIIETLKLSTYLIRNPDKLFKPQRRSVVNKYSRPLFTTRPPLPTDFCGNIGFRISLNCSLEITINFALLFVEAPFAF